MQVLYSRESIKVVNQTSILDIQFANPREVGKRRPSHLLNKALLISAAPSAIDLCTWNSSTTLLCATWDKRLSSLIYKLAYVFTYWYTLTLFVSTGLQWLVRTGQAVRGNKNEGCYSK